MSNRFNIGDIASGYRSILDGSLFDRFFAQPEDRDRLIIEDGEVEQTVDLMKRVVWKYIRDTKRIAAYLKGSYLQNTCENTWNFLYHHIQYKLDKKGLEQLRRPNRSWAERQSGIDCDCFSIFVSSILTNLKISHSFRITKYNRDVFQHVYVIVPIAGTSRYYTIDCVLNQFNFEKPFTEKKDFTMSLDGINVAVLSGADTTDVMDLVSGLDDIELLGATSDSEVQRSQAIYEHLVKTRNMIAQKPYLIAQVDYPPAFLKMLDYAIENWHTSNRTAALENLSRNEDVLNRINGMDGVPDDTEFDGTDEDWAHLEGLSAAGIQEELNGKRGKKKKKGFFRKIGQAVKTGVQKGAKALIRFNPLTISARAGFLLAMKLNIKKMASKLKWGYATKEQAAAKRVSAGQWQKSKNALSKIERLFADKLQGKRSALRNAILKGKAGGLSGFDNEEEIEIMGLGVAPAVALAAAVPVITAALKILSDAGLMKKGEAQNIESEVNAKTSDAELVISDQSTKSGDAETVVKSSGSDSESTSSSSSSSSNATESPSASSNEDTSSKDSNTEESTPAANTSKEADTSSSDSGDSGDSETVQPETAQAEADATDKTETQENKSDSAEADTDTSSNEGNDASSGQSVDGIMGFVKKQPLLAIGGVALGIWGLSKLFSGSKSSGKGLSGTSRRKGKKKKPSQKKTTRNKTKKQKYKGTRKLKSITLR